MTGDIGTYHGLGTMGIDWMSGAEMSEAIPPAFSEYIGRAAPAHAAVMSAEVQPGSPSFDGAAAYERFQLEREAAE